MGERLLPLGRCVHSVTLIPLVLVQSPVDQSQAYYQKRPVRIAHCDSEDVRFLLDTSTVRPLDDPLIHTLGRNTHV